MRCGAPKVFIPGIKVFKEKLDFSEYLEFTLGEHEQALNEPNETSNNVPRILSCLCLRLNTSK